SPSDWTFCANEHQRCAFTGAKEVHYGVTGTFTAPRTFTDGVSCSNGVFGDPIKGTVKYCEMRTPASGSSSPPPPAPSPSPAPPPPDTTPPSVPTGLGVSRATVTSVALSWAPSTDNVGVAGYRTYANGGYSSTTTQPTATVSGLRCGTAYTLGVDAVDASQNASARASIIGSTSACSDTQAPSTPTGVVVTSRT